MYDRQGKKEALRALVFAFVVGSIVVASIVIVSSI